MLKNNLVAGLLAGTLDITAACLHYFLRTGKGPLNVLRFVASGLLGQKAFTGDAFTMGTAGLLIHYFVAFSFAFLFCVLITHLPLLRRNWLVSGLLYGMIVWFIMNILVLPLSRAPRMQRNLAADLQAMAILMLCIGLPVSYVFLRRRKMAQHPQASHHHQ